VPSCDFDSIDTWWILRDCCGTDGLENCRIFAGISGFLCIGAIIVTILIFRNRIQTQNRKFNLSIHILIILTLITRTFYFLDNTIGTYSYTAFLFLGYLPNTFYALAIASFIVNWFNINMIIFMRDDQKAIDKGHKYSKGGIISFYIIMIILVIVLCCVSGADGTPE